MKQTRKKHSPVFKGKVALAALQGEHTERSLQSWPAGLKSTRARSMPGRRP